MLIEDKPASPRVGAYPRSPHHRAMQPSRSHPVAQDPKNFSLSMCKKGVNVPFCSPSQLFSRGLQKLLVPSLNAPHHEGC